MPDIIADGPHPTAHGTNVPTAPSQRHQSHSDAVPQGWFQHLQALEDAIAYRRARVSAPCPDCTADGRRCDDHACDLHLIAAYQRTAIAAIQDVSAHVHKTPADHDHGTSVVVYDANVP
jgi:hypothetical protein